MTTLSKYVKQLKVNSKKLFLDHDSGLGIIKPLNNIDNAINLVTTNQMISADSVLNNSKKEAMTATAAARKKDKMLMKSNQQSRKGRKPSVKPNRKHHQPNNRRHKRRSH